MKQVFLVGHITNDTLPYEHLGGAVAYTGAAMSGLGIETHIVTKCPENHPYIKNLEQRGIIVHNLPVRDPSFRDKITTFENIEDQYGHRRQIVRELQERISMEDIENFPFIPTESKIVIAPVIREVDTQLLQAYSSYIHVTVLPQGYFRYLENGEVKRRPWSVIDNLRHAEATILSDEDLSFNSEMSEETLEEIIKSCPLVILTKGPQGLVVYESHGKLETNINPYALNRSEIKDRTGAGDSFAGAFFAYYLKKPNAVEAGVFGAYFAALKIMAVGGEGIGPQTVPTLKDTVDYTMKNPENYKRYQEFREGNGVRSLFFFPEGQNRSSIERL